MLGVNSKLYSIYETQLDQIIPAFNVIVEANGSIRLLAISGKMLADNYWYVECRASVTVVVISISVMEYGIHIAH